MDIFLQIIAVPLGILCLFALFFIVALIVNYLKESIGIAILIVLGYGLGIMILGLDPIWK